GALLAKVRPPGAAPTFASLPEAIKDANVNPFPGLDGGFLGKAFAPFSIEANRDRTGFLLPDLFLPPGMTARRLADRRALLGRLDRTWRRLDGGAAGDLDRWFGKAFDVLRSRAVREAFALEREPAALRAAYGEHLF